MFMTIQNTLINTNVETVFLFITFDDTPLSKNINLLERGAISIGLLQNST